MVSYTTKQREFIVMFCTVKSVDKCRETADILIMFVILFQATVYWFCV